MITQRIANEQHNAYTSDRDLNQCKLAVHFRRNLPIRSDAFRTIAVFCCVEDGMYHYDVTLWGTPLYYRRSESLARLCDDLSERLYECDADGTLVIRD